MGQCLQLIKDVLTRISFKYPPEVLLGLPAEAEERGGGPRGGTSKASKAAEV